MQPDTKSHPLNNLSLKIIALVFGYTLWTTMSEHNKVQVALQAPLSFYNQSGLELEAPESVLVTVAGARDSLYQLTRDLAVHIDAKNLQEGQNTIALLEKDLLLPETIKLVHCSPKTITVNAKKHA
jgi:YbbR domain-containing protein